MVRFGQPFLLPRSRLCKRKGKCVRSHWISCRFYSAERLQNGLMYEGCMLHSGQSAASITPGGRWRGLPHPDHASKGIDLILFLKAAEQAGDSNTRCMHIVML